MEETTPDKLFYQIALTQINGVGDVLARNLLQEFGDAETIFKSGRKALLSIRNFSTKLVDEILAPEVMRRAEKEMLFVERNNIQTYFINDNEYPQRLRECHDAPVLLYFKGKTDFNAPRVISIVGTRNPSNYGNQFCDTFLQELAKTHPDTLIVSGLAYGIDISAHRSALKHGLPTIGVLAHGLDRIYPSAHKQTATEMIGQGGLLTEFRSETEPDRHNFVRRNRIVAGMADTVIVVESAEKGGSLITAELANSYCRDVFALPGRVSDAKSSGCNKLIAHHKADLFLSTDYFLKQMGWDTETEKSRKQPIQTNLFSDLSDEEQTIVNTLTEYKNLHVDRLSHEAGIPAYQLFSLLLEMEMKGLIKNLPGNMYTIA